MHVATNQNHSKSLNACVMDSKLLVVLTILCVCFLILDFTFWRDGKAVVDTHDCKHHCEWQLAKMNETFNTLIAVCEEKLQKLHGSDMNLAIIREQLHKEILELFWYEFQTFQRLHSTRTESVPQFCLEYCTVMNTAKHQECKENVTNSHYQIQMLLQRQRWLRIHIRRTLQIIRGNVNTIQPETLSLFWPSIIALVLIALVSLYIMTIAVPTRTNLATLMEEKERIEAQLQMVQTQLSDSISEKGRTEVQLHGMLSDSIGENERIEAQLHMVQIQLSEATSEKERIEAQLLTVQTPLLQAQANSVAVPQEMSEVICFGNDSQLKEKSLCWNEELLRCEIEHNNTLALKEKILQNAHKFWHQQLNEERSARKTAKENERASLQTIKAIESKYQWQLARESTRYQRVINELETKLKQARERDVEWEQIMVQRQEELEEKVRELERENTILEVKLEMSKIDLSMEIESKFRALIQVSGLEEKVRVLKVQRNRLEEGIRNNSNNLSPANQHPVQTPQESNCLQLFDSKLEEMRREFEAQFMQFQSKFDNQVTRDAEELNMLRSEHQRLSESLKLADRRYSQLESRLACQEPMQLYHNERTNCVQRQRLAWKRSSSLEQNNFEPIIVIDDYYCSQCSC